MVSKASDDFPDPESPVIMVRLFRGTLTLMFFKICSFAPVTLMYLFMLSSYTRDGGQFNAAVRANF